MVKSRPIPIKKQPLNIVVHSGRQTWVKPRPISTDIVIDNPNRKKKGLKYRVQRHNGKVVSVQAFNPNNQHKPIVDQIDETSNPINNIKRLIKWN